MMSHHLRTNSASNVDNRAFREAISSMRVEVLESKAETQQVKDQLNCLIMLVKRAWTGDQTAAVHVSNIVGVAPPKFEDETGRHGLTAVNNKSSSVHHWAMLSIGLLNRHYKQLEQQALSRAKSRLQKRQDFLDEQLNAHRDILERATRNRLNTQHKPNPYLDPESEALRQLKATSKSRLRPKSSPLQRPSYGSSSAHSIRRNSTDHTNHHNVMAANNLTEYLDMGHNFTTQQSRSVHENRKGSAGSKYVQSGLFDTSSVVPAADMPKKKRPTSGHLHKSDAKRAQPRNPVITKGERPLRYETTRPVSAKVSSSSSKQSVHTKPPRAQSAKTRTTYKPHDGLSLNLETERAPQDQRSYNATFVTEVQDCVQVFSQDMLRMQSMEDDFKRTAKMLQSRLGISGGGAV